MAVASSLQGGTGQRWDEEVRGTRGSPTHFFLRKMDARSLSLYVVCCKHPTTSQHCHPFTLIRRQQRQRLTITQRTSGSVPFRSSQCLMVCSVTSAVSSKRGRRSVIWLWNVGWVHLPTYISNQRRRPFAVGRHTYTREHPRALCSSGWEVRAVTMTTGELQSRIFTWSVHTFPEIPAEPLRICTCTYRCVDTGRRAQSMLQRSVKMQKSISSEWGSSEN